MTFVGLLTLAPLAAFLIILLGQERQSRSAALLLSLVIFIASLGLLVGAPAETNLPWIEPRCKGVDTNGTSLVASCLKRGS